MRQALFLVVLLLIAVGCGVKQSGDLESVDNAMAKAGSSRVEMTAVVRKREMFRGTGVYDYKHERGHMVLKPFGSEFDGSFPREGLFIGKTTYSGWTLLGKKRWLKESDYTPSGTETLIPGPGGPSPDRVLARIMESSKRVETLDNEEVRGVETKHYRAHLDNKKPGNLHAGGKELVVDAWVDGEGLLRRLRIPMGPAGEFTLDFFDYGVDVDLKPPSDGELVTQSELYDLIAAECKQRKERGEPWDESECTREDVVEGESEELPMKTVTSP